MNKKHIFTILFLALSIFIAYSNSLNGTWALDDFIANKPVGIKDIHDFLGFRKVTYFTFVLNQKIGTFNPINFRVFNILLHITNTLIIYVLTYLTVISILEKQIDYKHFEKRKDSNLSIQNKAFFAALLSGIIFGLHPININAVAYIVQRMASLATFFVLLALLFYKFARGSDRIINKTFFYSLTALSILLGLFSKENAIMAIPLIFLYDYIFLSRKDKKAFDISALKKFYWFKKYFIIILLCIAIIGSAFYLLKLHTVASDLIKLFLNPNQPLPNKSWMAVDVYWTPLQHILTEFRVISRYILTILLPLPRFLVFDWWGYPLSYGIISPFTTLLSVIFIIFLITFAIWRLKHYPMLCFAILWYFGAISLESFFALGSDLYFEHRNYLPVAGLFVGITGQLAVSIKLKQEKILWPVALILCIFLGILTFSRNHVWKDSVTLWSDTLNKAPLNIRAMIGLANAYLKFSDFNNAEKYFKQAVQLSNAQNRLSFLNDSVYSLGMLYLFQGKIDDAKKLIDVFHERFESYRINILIGHYKSLKNELDDAISEYKKIINKAKGRDKTIVLTLLGDTYRKKGILDESIDYYSKAISTDPSFSSAYYGIALSLINKRDVNQAYSYLQKALSLDPDNVLALSDMADLMLIMKSNPENAFLYAQRAVSKSPPFYQPYLTMGNVLVVLGKDTEADNYYKRATEIGMPHYLLLFSKARAYYIKGDNEKSQYYLSELKKMGKELPERIKNLIIK